MHKQFGAISTYQNNSPRFSPMAYRPSEFSLSSGSWQVQQQAWIPSCGEGIEFIHVVVDYPHNSHAITVTGLFH